VVHSIPDDAMPDLLRWTGKGWTQIETKQLRTWATTEQDGEGKDAPLETGLRDSIENAKALRNAVAKGIAEQLEERVLDGMVDRSVRASIKAGVPMTALYRTREAAQVFDTRNAPLWKVKEAVQNGTVTGLYISGYASTWDEDRDGDTVARDAFDDNLSSYLEDNPVLLLDHEKSHVLGAITDAKTDDVGLAIKAFIPKPEVDEERWKITAYRDIKRGLRKALSIGGIFHRPTEKAARKRIIRIDLFEISSVAVPSNPKSLFLVTDEKGTRVPMAVRTAPAVTTPTRTPAVVAASGSKRAPAGETLRESCLRLARQMPRRPYYLHESESTRAARQQETDEAMALQLAAAAKAFRG